MSDSSTPQTQQSVAMDVPAIRSDDLTKRFGRHTAVDGLTFEVHPGRVTGFLGPNGAGKTTTMRMILGLAEPTGGTATVLGRTYTELERTSQVGVLLDAAVFHPKRTARDHLRWVAAASHVDADRIDPVLDMVGLAGEADRRVGEFSLGMRQRLGLAGALLGASAAGTGRASQWSGPRRHPMDAPVPGLLRPWRRSGLRLESPARRDVVARRRCDRHRPRNARDPDEHPTAHLGDSDVDPVRAPRSERLLAIINEQGLEVSVREDDAIIVHGAAPPQIGELAAADGLVLHELVGETYSLEDIFLELTGDEMMSGLLKAESVKALTTRAFFGLILGAAGVAVLGAFSVIMSGQGSRLTGPIHDQTHFLLASINISLFAVVFGVRIFTDEFRHGSIIPTLLATPSRLKVVAGKVLIGFLLGFVLGIVATVTMVLISVPLTSLKGGTAEISSGDVGAVGGLALSAGLWSAIGVGLGAAIRSQVPAIVGALVWILVVENLGTGFLGDASRFLPGQAGHALANASRRPTSCRSR
jgi:ABC-2 type transport system ATP-binding protein